MRGSARIWEESLWEEGILYSMTACLCCKFTIGGSRRYSCICIFGASVHFLCISKLIYERSLD